MAAVYEARDSAGLTVALKLLHPEMAVKRDVRERFLREGYVANHLGHAGAVRALEHGDGGADGVYLAMELLVGETLAARVKRHGKLPSMELIDYADQILEVLAVAHDKGVVHRDLKPDNLFVTSEGRIKILDFGLARLLDGMPGDHKTRTGLALGTLPYMAPEQALGRRSRCDGRVDLFALGATMFRILSGRKVHEANSEAELLMAMASKPAPPLKSIAPETPDGLCAVIDLSLAFSRDARYPDARTMQADLREVRAGESPSYASSRFSAREEATRADRAAPSLPHPTVVDAPPTSTRSTVPLSKFEGPGSTQPLAAVPTPPGPSSTATPAGPPSSSSVSQTVPAFAPGYGPGPASSSALPLAVPAAPPARKGAGRTLALAAGLAVLLIGGAAAAWFSMQGSSAPEASAANAGVIAPPGEAARQQPATPGEPAAAAAAARAAVGAPGGPTNPSGGQEASPIRAAAVAKKESAKDTPDPTTATAPAASSTSAAVAEAAPAAAAAPAPDTSTGAAAPAAPPPSAPTALAKPAAAPTEPPPPAPRGPGKARKPKKQR